jgi:TRAP transporter TAXI family solute receptor
MKFSKQFLFAAIMLLSVGQVFSQMVILSGPERGSYKQFTDEIVALMAESGIELENQITEGSASNFRGLTNPALNYKMALIQSDYLHLMEATDKVNDTYLTSPLKVVMELAKEQIHMVAKKSSELTSLQDLDQKMMGIGSENQGGFATARRMRVQTQVEWRNVYVGFDEMLKRLKSGSIDVGLVVGSAPLDMLDIDPGVMVDGMKLLKLEDFNGWARYYENDTIYSGDYQWLEEDIPTFGVRTLLVVNEAKLTDEDKETVAAITSSIVQNLDKLKSQGHPKWKTVQVPE